MIPRGGRKRSFPGGLGSANRHSPQTHATRSLPKRETGIAESNGNELAPLVLFVEDDEDEDEDDPGVNPSRDVFRGRNNR